MAQNKKERTASRRTDSVIRHSELEELVHLAAIGDVSNAIGKLQAIAHRPGMREAALKRLGLQKEG